MNRLRTILAKTVLLAAVGFGLSACVAVAPEPSYSYAPGYYSYQPGYYAPRPVYSTSFFYYESSGRSGHRHHRGHHDRHHR